MQTSEIIKDLSINYMQGLGTMPRKYYLLNERIDTIQRELKYKLNKEKDKKKLDTLIETMMETTSMENDEQFVSGFVLATRIMAEVLNYKI